MTDQAFDAAEFAGENLVCIRGERIVFADLSFSLGPGEALLLLGPNGSGKSSLLRMMAGLLRPSAGQLTWGGEPVADDPEAHGGRSRYIGHHDAIKPVLTVHENVAFWSRLWAGDGSRETVEKALDAFSIGHLLEVPGRWLSAGQKRRVNLSRLLAAPAPLWLLDEPTTALDRATVATVEHLLAEHRARGGMVVLSTHTDVSLPGAKVLQMDDFAVDPALSGLDAEMAVAEDEPWTEGVRP
ncbi:ABC transporter involved in cytochrome c biogenesis, ATPase component CcmA [Caenispirillum salinarum AK4]|uniref:ABC transporter involved in cytochrome c biogenesis, ATPase component CcmA n=1 Tax=Caenispirillum salinarum AK4 TaxID=1238182 RepID=K9H574_9PROT|nr:heme ABC exporter ATP-binding protein CcmA [Caenispirillum salinarum]EKV32224.1 ABC transporter involved in cytochrome c biogenesis, ATPase component CcmA [Caenispirillum salinarum AK4]